MFERKKTLARIEQRTKTETLQTFALSYSSRYESLSMDKVSSMFDLGKDHVHSVNQ